MCQYLLKGESLKAFQPVLIYHINSSATNLFQTSVSANENRTGFAFDGSI